MGDWLQDGEQPNSLCFVPVVVISEMHRRFATHSENLLELPSFNSQTVACSKERASWRESTSAPAITEAGRRIDVSCLKRGRQGFPGAHRPRCPHAPT
jgi:hypothetical protein